MARRLPRDRNRIVTTAAAMHRRDFLTASSIAATSFIAPSIGTLAAADRREFDRGRRNSTHDPLVDAITTQAVWRNRDGQAETWFHPRACMVPATNGRSTALMTMQWIRGSDYFGPVQWTESVDEGETWSPPEPIDALGRVPVEGHDGLMAGVCDVVPQFHAATGTVLALGHVVFYRGERFSSGDQLSRYPVYSVRGSDGRWSQRHRLVWDDPRATFIYTNNCGQRWVADDGDILMSFTFGSASQHRQVAGVRCRFDGERLGVAEVGEAMTLEVGRGLLEPSVTRFDERFLMTIRAEDGHGYWAVSQDGVNYDQMRAWCWDDGEPLQMSTTQQHWLPHSDGLFLVYTRRDASNENVIRWRSPLWLARVDVESRTLIRDSEQIVLPLVGDGVNEPDGVALMGNFHVTTVSPEQSWVTVGEWLPRRNARGDLLMARIMWSRPNRRDG